MEYCVATFPCLHDALECEKTLKELKFQFQLIPVPREISSSCGLAVRFAPELLQDFQETIMKYQLSVDEIHILKERQNRKSLLNLLKN
ncbi:MAG TPA: DUF3343 domain-containing protein [Clostridia bacterium]|nr:DUF3343 domain-containing protein [Clostridia bacterium]